MKGRPSPQRYLGYRLSVTPTILGVSTGNTRNNWAELIEPVPEDAPRSEKKTKRVKPTPRDQVLGWIEEVLELSQGLHKMLCHDVVIGAQ
jgi:hypothetical protein